ncbi:hypothetical protein [Deefgea salmonis]|uniref:EF-hand domain-containing protein n=1 Tax=Deefgea salmonis TaxID=2875502 RepID=A0ABS8BKA6_9NEIS|nr:hypothetical protein [Deefgea salmonis]MCB5196155.1 hypothetical protein [Deefgea salmonis]
MRTSMKALLLAATVFTTSMAFAATPTCPKMPKGDITKAEHQKMSDARFEQMDANKDGTVTVAERRAAREAMRANCSSKKGHRGMAHGSMPAHASMPANASMPMHHQ